MRMTLTDLYNYGVSEAKKRKCKSMIRLDVQRGTLQCGTNAWGTKTEKQIWDRADALIGELQRLGKTNDIEVVYRAYQFEKRFNKLFKGL